MYTNVDFFIGIDQSINSTGITIQVYGKYTTLISKYELLEKHFYIINSSNKLTKKEEKAHKIYKEFDYIKYNKYNIKDAKDNHEAELYKTYNFINISRTIIAIISNYAKKYFSSDKINCYICMEGISYQSANTSSLLDLAGLNYLIRYNLLKYFSSIKEAIDIFDVFKLIISPPGEIKKFASGDGSAKKEVMITLFEAIHPNLYLIPKIDDIADSYWMSEYVINLYKR